MPENRDNQDEIEIKVRCPYCRRVFLFKPKTHPKGESAPRHRKVHCPYCDSPLLLPVDIVNKPGR